jgi:hypothetical protein
MSLVVGDREACGLRQQQHVAPVLRHVDSTEALLYYPRVPSLLMRARALATVREWKKRLEHQAAQLEDAMLRRLAKRRLARIEADIRLLENRLAQMIATDPDLARRYARLTSMPGVGPVLAFTLIALLPELGRMSRKQIAALIGLAPYDFEWQAAGTPQHLWRTHAGRKRAPAVTTPPSKHSTSASPPPARSPRSSLSPSCAR